MYIAFENELGKIKLNDGSWHLKEIDGLGLLEKVYSVATYPDSDGQELISAVTHSRCITMSGDILCESAIEEKLRQAIRIFNKNGTLKIQVGSKKRKIMCRCTSFVAPVQERNAVFQPFVVQFVADYPYFEDFENKRISIFLRKNLITSTFELPCVFTERIQRQNVVNGGDVDTIPKFFVVCTKGADETAERGFSITNHTTGKTFTLDYKMEENEEIVIDFAERKITSSKKTPENKNGNLITYMSETSFLSDMYFVPGVNDIECIKHDTTGEITMLSEYANKYIEAVV